MGAPPDIDTALAWRGRTVRDQDGEELGTLGELYLDSATSRPAWASVKRGLLRRTETIVPLQDAREVDDDLYVPYARDTFDSAPDVDPEVELTEEQERRLHEHYGREWAALSSDDDDPSGSGAQAADTRGDVPDAGPEVVRSEEEITVRKRPVERERVRLKKVVVDDQVKKVVPVRREVVSVEREPPAEDT